MNQKSLLSSQEKKLPISLVVKMHQPTNAFRVLESKTLWKISVWPPTKERKITVGIITLTNFYIFIRVIGKTLRMRRLKMTKASAGQKGNKNSFFSSQGLIVSVFSAVERHPLSSLIRSPLQLFWRLIWEKNVRDMYPPIVINDQSFQTKRALLQTSNLQNLSVQSTKLWRLWLLTVYIIFILQKALA